MIHYKSLIVIALTYTFLSCNTNSQNGYFYDLNSKSNYLNIRPTKYCFNGEKIYSLGTPNFEQYGLYGLNHFCYLKNGRVFMLTIDKNCYAEYKSQRYSVMNISEVKQLDQCNVLAIPFIDFNLHVGDTIGIYDNKFGSRYWVLLEDKKYSEIQADTIFKFVRHLGSLWNNRMIYYVSRKSGILGMGIMKNDILTDSLGYSFQSETIESGISLDFPEEDILSYFENISKK